MGRGQSFSITASNKKYNELLVRSMADQYLYYSTDMAQTWVRAPEPRPRPWKSGFVTEKGAFLVWDGRQVCLLTRDGKSEVVQPDAPVIWHGSEGIGEAGATVIYAEYSIEQQREVRVFRSSDYGHTWSVVFRQKTNVSDAPQVRHFHLVQPDPYHPRHWYLASGDSPKECHVWLSKDDGGTWKEVTDPRSVGTTGQSVHRFTSIIFTKDALWWGTDDLMHKKRACLVRATRGEPLHVEVLGDLSDECTRSAITTEYGMIFITEQKNAKGTGMHVMLYTKEGKVVDVGLIPRPRDRKYKSTGTCSIASPRAISGQFFTYGQPPMFGSQTMTYVWRFRPTGSGSK